MNRLHNKAHLWAIARSALPDSAELLLTARVESHALSGFDPRQEEAG
ncbi:MAG TPA: hypothetical protein VFV43_06360 [Limnobacter sp.]|nr:hypothetical protein [Limnobacter sp.]